MDQPKTDEDLGEPIRDFFQVAVAADIGLRYRFGAIASCVFLVRIGATVLMLQQTRDAKQEAERPAARDAANGDETAQCKDDERHRAIASQPHADCIDARRCNSSGTSRLSSSR